jgi:hypothetical protein
MLKSNLSIFLVFCFVAIFISSSQAKKIGTVTKQPDIDLPTALNIPDGNEFKFLLFASGVQTYKCTINSSGAKTWPLVEPDADLINEEEQPFEKKKICCTSFLP